MTITTMDVEALHVTLQQTLNPDVSVRGPAEETIRNLKHMKGATAMLLQVAAEKQVSSRYASTKEQNFEKDRMVENRSSAGNAVVDCCPCRERCSCPVKRLSLPYTPC